jgi:hypothetical protein
VKAGSDLMQYKNMIKLQHQSGWCHASIILPLLGVAMPEVPHAEKISGQIMIVKFSGLWRGPLESGSSLLVTNSHRIAFQLIPAACWECVSCVLCLRLSELTVVCCATIDNLFQGPLPAARWLAAVLPSCVMRCNADYSLFDINEQKGRYDIVRHPPLRCHC